MLIILTNFATFNLRVKVDDSAFLYSLIIYYITKARNNKIFWSESASVVIMNNPDRTSSNFIQAKKSILSATRGLII